MHPDAGQTDRSADDESPRITRRRAIQAAVAGAGAVAVWSAPRIEGLSLAQDTAAAASCVSGTWTANQPIQNAGSDACWSATNTPCQQVNLTFAGTGSTDFAVTGALNGSYAAPNQGNGLLNVTVNGIEPPFQSCTVTVNGTCSQGTPTQTRVGGTNNTLTTSGTLTYNANCVNVTNIPSSKASLTVAVTCTCL